MNKYHIDHETIKIDSPITFSNADYRWTSGDLCFNVMEETKMTHYELLEFLTNLESAKDNDSSTPIIRILFLALERHCPSVLKMKIEDALNDSLDRFDLKSLDISDSILFKAMNSYVKGRKE